jgi:hypothetical protein
MQTGHTSTLACSAFMIAALVGCTARVTGAQTLHRAKVHITAGPTVQVSKAVSNVAHYENLAAGDPMHPGRLISCSMVYPNELWKYSEQNCYVSFDGGKSWEPTLKITEDGVNADPTVAYGQGDDVYVVTIRGATSPSPANTLVFKSTDGGRTWNEASRFAWTDRPFIAVDRTDSKYAGRLYVLSEYFVKDLSASLGSLTQSLEMWRSLDNGKTFLGPVRVVFAEGTKPLSVGTGAVLSDGSFVGLFALTKKERGQVLEREPSLGPNAEIHVISSKDGGATFTESHKIADVRVDRSRSEGGIVGQLAADPGSKAFKDRLYAVFPAIISDRIQIQCSYSSDMGTTWSRPVTVNDDRSPEQGGKGPDHLLPSVGVNRDGVVLVTWYDRREANDNLGWRLRAAASLDGGETFSASVPVTDNANIYSPATAWDIEALGTRGFQRDDEALVSMNVSVRNFFTSGGHTTGLAIDADGTFHPTWIDNHTGIAQLWSASMRVDGTVVKHGAADLTNLADISQSVTLEPSKRSWDQATGTLSVTAQLWNTSNDTVQGPVKVRAVILESELGVPEVTNADNGQDGTGAVWDFSSQLSGGRLTPTKLSGPRTLTFRLWALRALGQGRELKTNILTLHARVYGNLHKGKSQATHKAAAEDTDKQ